MQHLKFAHRFRQAADLVIRQRQVHPHPRVARNGLNCLLIFADRRGELPVAHQRRSQVRTDLRRIGVVRQELAIQPDGGGHVAGFVGRVGAAQHVGGWCGAERHERQESRRACHRA